MYRDANSALTELWAQIELAREALDFARLTGAEPVLTSSFAVATAAQATIADASELVGQRGR